jgi:menaquinone-dependent protoporphyrinogen oxidase
MRVLVTWGSKAGGTEGIARIIGEALAQDGHDIRLVPAAEVRSLSGFDAAIVGGALYGGRWHADASRLVAHQVAALRRIPVWLFSSGPLDDSATRGSIAPTRQVSLLMDRVGALGHATFGGRLLADAKGFPASAMAKQHSGDWRDPEQIRAWAGELARALPGARPGPVVVSPGHSLGRLLEHGLLGGAITALLLAGLLAVAGTGTAVTLRALAAPVVFLAISLHYFRARGARAPLSTALGFAGLALLVDLVVVAGAFGRSLELYRGFAGGWLPLLLVVAVTWATGAVLGVLPSPRPPRTTSPAV